MTGLGASRYAADTRIPGRLRPSQPTWATHFGKKSGGGPPGEKRSHQSR